MLKMLTCAAVLTALLSPLAASAHDSRSSLRIELGSQPHRYHYYGPPVYGYPQHRGHHRPQHHRHGPGCGHDGYGSWQGGRVVYESPRVYYYPQPYPGERACYWEDRYTRVCY